MSAAPWASWPLIASARMSLAMLVVCSSCENWAICAMNSVSFIGSRGFWLLIWVARIRRKPSDEKMSVFSTGSGIPVEGTYGPVTGAGGVTGGIGVLLREKVEPAGGPGGDGGCRRAGGAA